MRNFVFSKDEFLISFLTISEEPKIWAYAWGRYKSSLGMYSVGMASNHTAALCRGEFGGHH